MKSAWMLLVLTLFSVTVSAKVHIVWGTDLWPGYTESDGSGFYQALIARIFKSGDYDVDIEYLPWQRVTRSIVMHEIDMTGAIHKTDEFYQSAQPVLSNDIVIVYLQGNPVDANKLHEAIGAYRNGYKDDIFNKIVPASAPGVPVASADVAARLLREGKIDYYADLVDMVKSTMKKSLNGQLVMKKVGQFHLYWAFVKSNKGLYLKEHFDKQFMLMKESGELAQLYQRHKITPPATLSSVR